MAIAGDQQTYNPSCPVCDSTDWRGIGSKTYRLADFAALSPYIKKRFRVLFEVWFPNAREVEITSRLCERCGFVLYTPRPTDADIDAKYRFLGTLAPDGEALGGDLAIDLRRARILYRKVKEYLPRGQAARVLDFGGGDGRLMQQFVRRGCECFLVDYRDDTIPGVRRLGTTLADIASDAEFDLIVCSHVIEHVASPLKVIAGAKEHLAPRGTLYVEVPMEIWGRAPLQDEPVTHVNFFSPSSLRTLMERAGLRVLSSRLGAIPHPAGRVELVIRAVGANEADLQPVPTVANRSGLAETERLLHPTVGSKFMRRLLMPSTIPAAIAYEFRCLVRKCHSGLGSSDKRSADRDTRDADS